MDECHAETSKSVNAIEEILRSFDHDKSLKAAQQIAAQSQPYLKEVISAAGTENCVTLDISTKIVHELLKRASLAVNSGTDSLLPLIKRGDDIIDQYIAVLNAAMAVYGYAGRLVMSPPYRKAYERQVSKLEELIRKAIQIKNEKTYSKRSVCWEPHSIDVKDVHERSFRWSRPLLILLPLIILAAIATAYFLDVWHERHTLDDIKANYTEEGIMSYLADTDNTHYTDEALALYLNAMDSILLDSARMMQPTQFPPLTRMDNFARNASLPAHISRAISERVQVRTDSLYQAAVQTDDIGAWIRYQSMAPSQYYYDSSARIDSLDLLLWNSEPTAWQAALSANDKDNYTRYIDSYPHGPHIADAHRHLIDIEVNAYRNRSNSAMEKIDRIGDYPGHRSRVCLFNYTDYTLHFLFSGSGSTQMTIPPGGSDFKDIDDGDYRVLVKIDNPKADKFTFTQTFDHGIYSSSLSLGEGK